MLRPASTCLFLIASSLPAWAQWPTFADGDLLYRPDSISGSGGASPLLRIDPVAASAVELVPDTFNAYSDGAWLVLDPFRDVLLMYTSRFATGPFSPRLWAVRADGLTTDLGLLNAALSALAPVGDGRVYCTASRELSLLDAAGGLQPVLDTNGMPFDVPVDHLYYEPTTNSLVGVARTGFPGTCTVFGEIGLHRYDLTVDGTALRAPAAYTPYFHGGEGIPIGLDPLPGGDLLLTMNSGLSAGFDLRRLDPVTLAISDFAEPDSNDKDGGVWSQVLGTAVFVDDMDNSFRTMGQGGSGAGVEILADLVPGDQTTGVSTTFEMTDVERQPGACPGTISSFGSGLAGSGGLLPTVDVGACPRIGSTLPVHVAEGPAGGVGLLLVGRFTGALPLFGGTVYVLPPYASQPLVFADSNGAAQLMLPVPDLSQLVGVSFFLQAGFADLGAVQGVSLSAALELVLG
jgi:hypothetical protein